MITKGIPDLNDRELNEALDRVQLSQRQLIQELDRRAEERKAKAFAQERKYDLDGAAGQYDERAYAYVAGRIEAMDGTGVINEHHALRFAAQMCNPDHTARPPMRAIIAEWKRMEPLYLAEAQTDVPF